VQFSDLSGYTALNERLDPEEVASVMDSLRTSATRVVESFGGIVNQFVGDQVMALFGVPLTHEDDAERAVRASFELHRVVRRLGDELAPRLGQALRLHTAVNTGLLITERRDSHEGVYVVTGDAVTTGARLAEISGADEIFVGPETHRAIRHTFDTEEVGLLTLRGKADPVIAHRVIRPRAESRFDAVQRRGIASFTGRHRELGLLYRCLEEAKQRKPHLVAVYGEPGVGKSRLFHEFELGLSPEVQWILHGQCPSFGTVAPYSAFLGMLRCALGLDRQTGEDPTTAALRTLRAISPELEHHLPLYFHLLSLRSPAYPLPAAQQGEALRELAPEALTEMVHHLAQQRPVLLLLSDWHWADESSERALRHLVTHNVGQRLLVLVNYRSHFDPNWTDLDPILVELAPLDEPETYEFVKSILGSPVGVAFAARVHRHTGGNPLFIEELCRSLAERTAHGEPVEQVLTMDGRLGVTASIEAVLHARLDRLDVDAAEVLRIAAVLGDEFDRAVLDRLLASPEGLSGALQRLEEADLIQRLEADESPRYCFKHTIVRSVAYDTLLRRRRRELHAAAARAIEAVVGEVGLDAHTEALAHHYALSNERAQAVHYLELSGDKAVASGAMVQGLQHYRAAVRTLDELEPNPGNLRHRIDLSLRLANAAIYRPSSDSIRVLERSLVLAEQTGYTRGAIRSLYWMGWLEHALGLWSDALPHFQRCAREAESAGDEKLLAQLYSNIGQVYFYATDYSPAVEHLETAIRERLKIEGGRGRQPVISYSMGFLAMIAAEDGRFEEAYRVAREALESVRDIGALEVEGALTSILAVVQMFRGDWDGCRGTAERLSPRAQRVGSIYMLAISRTTGGYAAFCQGEREDGLALLRQAVRDLENTEVRMAISLNYACLAEALALTGEVTEAEGWANKGLARALSGDRLGEVQAQRALGLAEMARPSPDPARASDLFARAAGLATAKGSRRDLAITRLHGFESGAVAGSAALLKALVGEFESMGMDSYRERAASLAASV
jgi:class 3 adenylate cyclase/tetratricopeptide (TPR) repeat protein